MDIQFAQARATIRNLPRAFVTKDARPLTLDLFAPSRCRGLVDAYLGYQPRNSFQGLPPPNDSVCVRWVEGMMETGVNLAACCSSGEIAGHAALFPIDGRRCEMLIVVWPQFQNVGIGTALTQACIESAAELGFQRIWLPVDATNVRARHIYRKCGFQNVSRELSREVEMVCDLKADAVTPTVERFAPAYVGFLAGGPTVAAR